MFSKCLLRLDVVRVFVSSLVLVLYGPFCHGALKHDISTLFTTFFVWTSLQFICIKSEPFCCPTGWKITLVGSRFTHPAESRYAPIEGEALAVADSLDKARYFVLECRDLIIAVDHKPLLRVLGDRSLEDISNTRLRNLKEKTLRYRFRMIHIPGVKHRATDSLSRHPTGDAEKLVLLMI